MIESVPFWITVGIVVAALVGMAVSWRRRAAGQQDIELPDAPADRGAPVAQASGLYLATTFAGRPLDRVVARGLGYRAGATVTATTTGVAVELDGGTSFFIAAADVVGAGVATWTIDRTVERNGLTVVGWTARRNGAAIGVESSFRIDIDPRADLIAAVQRLAPHTNTEVDHADH